jgi:hypothetical protein
MHEDAFKASRHGVSVSSAVLHVAEKRGSVKFANCGNSSESNAGDQRPQ